MYLSLALLVFLFIGGLAAAQAEEMALSPSGKTAPEEQGLRESRVSISAVKADLKDLFSDVARQAQANILVAGDVNGSLSIAFKDVHLKTALQVITQASGLELTVVHGVYVINSAQPVKVDLPGPDALPHGSGQNEVAANQASGAASSK